MQELELPSTRNPSSYNTEEWLATAQRSTKRMGIEHGGRTSFLPPALLAHDNSADAASNGPLLKSDEVLERPACMSFGQTSQYHLLAMMLLFQLHTWFFAVWTVATNAHHFFSLHHNPFQVDLGYSVYEGFKDNDTGLNTWLGIAYAAPPVGDARWRAPTAPAVNRSLVIQAKEFAPRCPGAPSSPPSTPWDMFSGNEDCLYLNVYAPDLARNLPVLVYIHGGGYGTGSGMQNLTQLAQMNKYGFVGVVIQYRLAAFGFLAGTAIHDNGTANAGLLDQHACLEWIQQHIRTFGGDPRKVTIAGQSAGAGSVEMQAMAYGGSEGTRFFDQGIAASPYTPVQYRYDDAVPEQNYLKLAKEVGCWTDESCDVPNADPAVLQCLRQANSTILQKANFAIGTSANYGSWAFVPVIDGKFIRQRPSQQLLRGKVNGRRILTGHNSNEGAEFVNPNITTRHDFHRWLRSEYPKLCDRDIHEIDNVYYPLRNESAVPFATCGDCDGPTAINTGSFATGHLQRAIAIYSEATIDCPSYWLAAAYQGHGKKAYKYTFTVPSGKHGLDQVAESFVDFPNFLVPNIGADLHAALSTSFGNFIATGNPSVSNALANGQSTGNRSSNAMSRWPRFRTFSRDSWQMINMNQTGGTEYRTPQVAGLPPPAQYLGPGLKNDFRQVDGFAWEGGIGRRCEFWRKIGNSVPV